MRKRSLDGYARSKATEHMRGVSDAELWQMRSNARAKLVHFSRRRLARGLASSGAPAAEVDQAARILDPNVLTLGFARRFATYKRPTLLLSDPERLVRILTNPHRPVQVLIAGKAHPADEPGQALIRQWTDFIRRRPEVRPHAVFLSDYDMLLTEQMVHGVDVWINNPRRPWEACGTSGMKVLANGGINLSELDGWWAEAYEPGVGWAIRKEHLDDTQSDAAEAEALYAKLEEEIIPLFDYRDSRGLPVVGFRMCVRAWHASRRSTQPTAQCASTRRNIICAPRPCTMTVRRRMAHPPRASSIGNGRSLNVGPICE